MAVIYTVILERIPEYSKPNFHVYVEDKEDTRNLQFICYRKSATKCSIPMIERVAKRDIERLFQDFEIVELDSLAGLIADFFEFENKEKVKQAVG